MKTVTHQTSIEHNGKEIEFEVQITCFHNYDTFIDDTGVSHVVDDQYVLEDYEVINTEQYTSEQIKAINQFLTTEYLLNTFQNCIKYE